MFTNVKKSLAVILGVGLLITFAGLLGHLILKGAANLNADFFLQTPENAGRDGGIAPVIVSTFLIVLISKVLLIPFGSILALQMHDFHRTKLNGTKLSVLDGALNVLAGTPSIVFGLLGYYFFCQVLGFGYSIISGALTLFCMCLPFYTKVFYEQLNVLDKSQFVVAKSLGLSRFSYLLKVVLPQARNSVATALILSLGRAFSETAALLFTSGYSLSMPTSVFDSGRTISIHIYDLAMNVPGGDANAYSSVIVLMAIVLSFNFAVSFFVDERKVNEGVV